MTLHEQLMWSLQASCSTVVQETDQPFTRLNHHKSHEYARATANRNTSRPFSLYKVGVNPLLTEAVQSIAAMQSV